MGFRITTWNVNGIRNPFGYQPWREKRTFQAMFDILEADIVVMQETKIQRKDLRDDMVLVPGWDVSFSLPKHKKGYSGVAIYTRNSTCAPIRAEEGITGCLPAPRSSTSFRNLPKNQQIGGYPLPGQLSGVIDEATLDSEGRCVILEFPAFVLLGVYSPAQRDETRNDFRIGYLEALDVRIRNLVAAGKQVILTGDLNVSRSAMDSTNLNENLRKEGITIDEWLSAPSRRLFNNLIFEGLAIGNRDENREKPVLWDLCRCFHPTREGMNTCWDTKKNTRPANNGSRIDYVLCTDGLKDWFTHSNIQEGLHGSDHCPVFATTADTVKAGDKAFPIADLVNPPGMFEDGVRKRDWGQKDLLPLSARLIPEFDRRQNIRDMFTKKSTLPQTYPATPEGLICAATPEESTCAATTLQERIERSRENSSQRNPSGTNSGNEPAVSPRKPDSPRRAAEMTNAPTKRRLTTETSSSNAKTRVVPGQRTLQGFFKPKNINIKTSDHADAITNTATLPIATNTSSHPAKPTHTAREGAPPTATDLSRAVNSAESQKVFDPIEAKESWSKLLGKRIVPRCESHNEPCISLVTKKPGVNCGRSFYICPRPLGPSGDKEKDSEWRCGTFIWSSDWNGNTS